MDFSKLSSLKCDCMICGCPNHVKVCSVCKSVSYCSTECQRKDWSSHKRDCKILATQIPQKRELMRLFKSNAETIFVAIQMARENAPIFQGENYRGEYRAFINSSGVLFTKENREGEQFSSDQKFLYMHFVLCDEKFLPIEIEEVVVSMLQKLPIEVIEKSRVKHYPKGMCDSIRTIASSYQCFLFEGKK